MSGRSFLFFFAVVFGMAIPVAIAGSPMKTDSANPPHITNTDTSMERTDWTPRWAKEAIWYQIFPDRFHNGDRSNDPTLASMRGAWPHDLRQPWQVHPWTSDWYRLQPYEQANEKDFWFNVQRRRYGGDIAGMMEKISYLQELGINALYLNPVFMAPSSHKYDGATYHHIDPYFGPDPEGDLKLIAAEIPHDPATWRWTAADRLMLQFIRVLHQRGLRIIFDGVFNHMGLNSWAFQDVVKNQNRSPYRDWFDIVSWDDPAKKTKFKYNGWFGVKELPELREDAQGIVEGPKKYIFDCTRRWMDPDGDGDPGDGIDGWRLDVAFCVAHPFWQSWRGWVKQINPEAYLTAEVIDPAEAIKPYLRGDEFDAVMNYNFAFACSEFFIDKKNGITVTQFDRRLRELRDAFDPCVTPVMQNLFDSHDANRLASHIVNRDLAPYAKWGQYYEKSKASNPKYDTRKPGEAELAIQKLMVIFQMTYIGAPMVYYGDEAGMWGANDPCCRKPMVWQDLEYEPETVLPDGRLRAVKDPVEFDRALYEHYRRMIAIRRDHPIFAMGDFHTLLLNDAQGVMVFERTDADRRAWVLLNNSDREQTVEWDGPTEPMVRDLLNGENLFPDGGRWRMNLKPKWARILVP